MPRIWSESAGKIYKGVSENIRVRQRRRTVKRAEFLIENRVKTTQVYQWRWLRGPGGFEMEGITSFGVKGWIHPKLYGFWYHR